MQSKTLRTQMLAFVAAPVAICLLLIATLLINIIDSKTSKMMQTKVTTQLTMESLHIERFFEKYALLSKTFNYNPMFMHWFENLNEATLDRSGDAEYKMINDNFIRISSGDDNIFSVFFASDITGEYFREDEVTGLPNDEHDRRYNATKRPWYIATRSKTNFSLGSPSADLSTGRISSVIQAPIRNAAGKVLGVGGIDLNLEYIVKFIDDIAYEGQG